MSTSIASRRAGLALLALPFLHIGHLLIAWGTMNSGSRTLDNRVIVGLVVVVFIVVCMLWLGVEVLRGRRFRMAIGFVAIFSMPGWCVWFGYVLLGDEVYPIILYIYEGLYLAWILLTLLLLVVGRQSLLDEKASVFKD